MPTEAKIILDSISPNGDRLTSMEVKFHRFVLSEWNTHRQHSKSARSDRAVPISFTVKEVTEDLAFPLEWGKAKAGMSFDEELDPISRRLAIQLWQDHAKATVEFVSKLDDLGLHKSVANRPLEPYLWQSCIVSSTSWQNFFNQRISPLAQPEIHAVAKLMKEALDNSVPNEVQYGEWHTPYIDDQDGFILDPCKVSAARCARVSYNTHGGHRDPAEDLALYNRLVTAEPMHASPLEHVATPAKPTHLYMPWRKQPLGNFTGWHQLRHTL